MGTGRTYVAALSGLAAIDDVEERRRAWRQAAAALAGTTGRGREAPLEGLDPQALLATTRVLLGDRLLDDMSFLAPAAAAIAIFTLAGALPPGPERRELGRRVLAQLDTADADTFVALASAVAVGSRRPLTGSRKRARVAAALSAPLAAGTGADGLALALLSGPELQRDWLDQPSTGSLAERRLAARVLERAAREAVRRERLGDDGGVLVLGRATVRAAWDRLLGDREWLVWRHAAVARGLLSECDAELSRILDRGLASSDPSTLRRAAAALAARIEIDTDSVARCHAFLDSPLASRDPGAVRGLLTGLAGAFTVEPEAADDLGQRAVGRAGLEAIEALVDLRQDGATLGPLTVAAAVHCLDQARAAVPGDDDGFTALLAALAAELTGDPASVGGSVSMHATRSREALRAGQLVEAVAAARAAAEVVAEAIEFLQRADDDPIDRRHAFRTLRELDRELLADGTVMALLTAEETRGGVPALGELLGGLEQALLSGEARVEHGPIAHPVLRLARLRALVRTVDTDSPADEGGRARERRLAVVRTLVPRARDDRSALRRAVWAALSRAFDAMLRAEQLEVSDLVAGWTSAMDPDEEFRVAREASMVPEVRAVLGSYAAAMAAIRGADPDDRSAAIAAVATVEPLLTALGAVSTPRSDALRGNLARLVRALDAVVRARGLDGVPHGALEQLESCAGVLADLVVGSRRRLGLAVAPVASPAALHALARSIERLRRGAAIALGPEIAAAIDATGRDQFPLAARMIGLALARLSRLPAQAPRIPRRADTGGDDEEVEAELPAWLPASRTIGGFYVLRPLGKGTGGSVFVACRGEDRHRQSPPQVALKVPDYDGGAARTLSVDEFEALFRVEAGTLLALPAHPNLARFVTFDAGASPKPILVMEYVDGQTLEQLIDLAELDTRRALQVIDGIAAGLEVMHGERIAHLDVKPANVILRGDDGGAPVLVDFGLAGRHLRPGCGTPYYAAPEVWGGVEGTEPPAADVYALGCLVYELLTHEILVDGESISDLVAAHQTGLAEARVLARLGRDPLTSSLAEVVSAAVRCEAWQRPSIGRVRTALASLADGLGLLPWPLAPG